MLSINGHNYIAHIIVNDEGTLSFHDTYAESRTPFTVLLTLAADHQVKVEGWSSIKQPRIPAAKQCPQIIIQQIE